MKKKLGLFCALFILSGCVTMRAEAPRYNGNVPTSERLEKVRQKRAHKLARSLAAHGFSYGAPVFIRIFKKEGRLEAWVKDSQSGVYEPYKAYPICKYSGGFGPKLREGDGQSPEGFYLISGDQLNPNSAYHLSFNLGFPNEYDQARGRTGSLLMVHGGCKSVGCYAMRDYNMEEIYLLIEASIRSGANVPVHIFPFRMKESNLYTHFDPLWNAFWRNLQEGYDMFERTRIPPQVSYGARQGQDKYVFQDPTNLITALGID